MQELEKILQDDKFWDILFEEACVEGKQAERIEQRMREEIIEKDGWIPVDERLPEVGEYVLGTTKYSEVLIFRYGWNSPHTKKMFLHMCGAAASGITAWMPLPDPYRTEDCCGEYKQDWKAGFMQRFERRI